MQVERSGPVKLECLHKDGSGSPLSGRRVSNTWVTCLRDWDNSWKRLLIPNKRYVKISLKGAFKASLKDGPAAY